MLWSLSVSRVVIHFVSVRIECSDRRHDARGGRRVAPSPAGFMGASPDPHQTPPCSKAASPDLPIDRNHMKVRAITVGIPVPPGTQSRLVSRAGTIAFAVREALDRAGIETQTVRLALPPVTDRFTNSGASMSRDVLDEAAFLDESSRLSDFGHVSFGTIDTLGTPDAIWTPLLDLVPEIIATTSLISVTATVATRKPSGVAEINIGACRRAGSAVARIAHDGNGGFGNFRFAALANCGPNIPFFPAAYHDGGDTPAVGIGLQCADLVVDAFTHASSLEDARSRLVGSLTEAVNKVAGIVRGALDRLGGIRFNGVDFSPAPLPGDGTSIGGAFERLGLPAFGGHGTVFVASFLTECLQEVATTTGMTGMTPGGRTRPFAFSGLMMPVLEDSVLAQRASSGHIGIERLLLASAVCGLGLDTVPLSGDTSAGTLGAIILDMATLAVRLDKPLSARLFPVPGTRAGDDVSWDTPYFSPSVAMGTLEATATGVLGIATRHVARLDPFRPG